MTIWPMRIIVVIIILVIAMSLGIKSEAKTRANTSWSFQSIDTMKYSRDLAREKGGDLTYDQEIENQVKNIANAGATHIAIATPYDDEFLSYLKRWVRIARKYDLSIWFRGNWSGWENWFGYEDINRTQHIQKTQVFILRNSDLFEDGDVFTACPECENGGPGDPRHNGDVAGHRQFLIDEYQVTRKAFEQIGKNVSSNYNSMNGDVAELIMDKNTTASLDGLVVVDHYVKSPEQLLSDINKYAEQSGGKVILGEFGAPIPDIHGNMSETVQRDWLEKVLKLLLSTDNLIGLNYWTNHGSSTQLWNNSQSPRLAVETIKKYYSPRTITLHIKDEAGLVVSNAIIRYANREYKSGNITFPVIDGFEKVTVTADGFHTTEVFIGQKKDANVIMIKIQEDWWFILRKTINQFFNMIYNLV